MSTVNTNTLQGLGISSNQQKPKEDKELGQQEFLELMIAQVKSQDPFKPMENGEFLSQIAQFSTVNGIQDLQDSFSSMAGSLNSNQALQASALVGRSVMVNSEVGVLTQGGTISGAIGLPEDSTEVTIGFYNQAGELIRELPLGPQDKGIIEYKWDGLKDDGTAAVNSPYQIVARAKIDGEDVALGTLVSDNVESVILGRPGEGTVLNLSALGATDFNRIEEIR